MSRANTIAGVTALAFIVYITVKGQLPGYAAIFKAKPKATTQTASNTTSNTPGIGDTLSHIDTGTLLDAGSTLLTGLG